MPIAVLEAMAFGLPVVASDIAGTREALVNERTGLLFRSGDARALAHQLQRLATDANLRAHLGTAALADARERFSLQRMVDEIVAVYREVAEQQRRAISTGWPDQASTYNTSNDVRVLSKGSDLEGG
jgi:glycosyltransferase involved in cell wall biosynthesis